MVNYQRGDFGRGAAMGCACSGVHLNGDFGASYGNMGEDVQNLPYTYQSSAYDSGFTPARSMVNIVLALAAAFLAYKYLTRRKA